MANKPAHIEIEHGYYECGDGCCTEWHDEIRVNGKPVAYQLDDMLTNILAELLGISEDEIERFEECYGYGAEVAILTRLGFDVKLEIDDHVSEDMEHAREMRQLFDNEYE